MMRRLHCSQFGQAAVEMAIVLSVLLMLTAGLVDFGRAFFQNNALAAAARYGARWGSVMGGTCLSFYQSSTNDWCNQLNNTTTSFWSQPGNVPLQGLGVACPSYSSTPGDYYQVSAYTGASSTTIIGALAHKYDSSSTSTNFITGIVTPGVNLTKLYACIELPDSSGTPQTGDSVGVVIYYPFTGVTNLLFRGQINLNATSTYQIE